MNSALIYEPKCGVCVGDAGSQPMSTAVHMEPWHGAQINFGKITPNLTYASEASPIDIVIA